MKDPDITDCSVTIVDINDAWRNEDSCYNTYKWLPSAINLKHINTKHILNVVVIVNIKEMGMPYWYHTFNVYEGL